MTARQLIVLQEGADAATALFGTRLDVIEASAANGEIVGRECFLIACPEFQPVGAAIVWRITESPDWSTFATITEAADWIKLHRKQESLSARSMGGVTPRRPVPGSPRGFPPEGAQPTETLTEAKAPMTEGKWPPPVANMSATPDESNRQESAPAEGRISPPDNAAPSLAADSAGRGPDEQRASAAAPILTAPSGGPQFDAPQSDTTLTAQVDPRRRVDTLAEEPAPLEPVERSQAIYPQGDYSDYSGDAEDVAEAALRSIRTASALKSERYEKIAADLTEPWPEPVDPFAAHVLPGFDPALVLPCLRPLVANIAAMQGCDMGIPYLQAVTFAAGCLSDDIRVRVKPNQDWHESARLWACIVGESGDGKSPSMRSIMREARDLNLEIGARCREAQARYKDDYDVYDAQRKAWIAKRAKGELGGERPIPPAKPVNELLYFNNFTQEGLLEQLEATTRGAMAHVDEFIGLLAGLDQYKAAGKGDDRTFLLSSWDGAEFVGIRVGKLRNIANTGLTIIGSSQPGAIQRAVQKMDMESDGLIQRVLVYVSQGAAAQDDVDQASDQSAVRDWRAILHRLYHMRTALDHCIFSEGAERIRREAFAWIHSMNASEDIPMALRQALAKWRGYLPRLALTLHCIECADQGRETVSGEIAEHTMSFAWEYMRECLWQHQLYFYSAVLGQQSDDWAYMKFYMYLLVRRDREIVSLSDFQRDRQTAWKALRTDAQLSAVILRFVRAGILRPTKPPRGQDRLSSQYAINPRLYVQQAHRIEAEEQRCAAEHARALERRQRAPGEH